MQPMTHHEPTHWDFLAWAAEVLIHAGQLTPSESEVVEGLLLGRTYRDIAVIRGGSVDTVKWHVKRILRKLQADSTRDFFRVIAREVETSHPFG